MRMPNTNRAHNHKSNESYKNRPYMIQRHSLHGLSAPNINLQRQYTHLHKITKHEHKAHTRTTGNQERLNINIQTPEL